MTRRFSVYLNVVASDGEMPDELGFIEAGNKAELFESLANVLRVIADEMVQEGEFWGIAEGLDLDD